MEFKYDSQNEDRFNSNFKQLIEQINKSVSIEINIEMEGFWLTIYKLIY